VRKVSEDYCIDYVAGWQGAIPRPYRTSLMTKAQVEQQLTQMARAGTYEAVQVLKLVPVETEIEYERVQVTKIKEQ